MNIDGLRSLQQRIRASTGADLDLDWDIWKALCQPVEWWGQKIESVFRDGDTTHTSSWGCNTADGYRHLGCGYIGRYTTDPDGLGACVALQRALLPGCYRYMHQFTPDSFYVEIIRPDERVMSKYKMPDGAATHSLETHAHLLSIIAAVIAEEEAQETASA